MQPANDNGAVTTFISMFSGIEAASVAFGPLGWKALAFAEIEKFPSALLAHHYPDVPNVGDMTNHDWSQYHHRVDIVCGGPPCQAFSVAGLRQSLGDARGNLSLSYMRALHAIDPKNAIVENVPGWLNTPDNAFGCFLAGIVGADDALIPSLRPADGKSDVHWKWNRAKGKHTLSWPSAGMVSGPKGRAAWRIQDAQFHGLAQRRRRVLLVADFGRGADPAAVLFERASLSGNTPPSRETGENVARGTAYGISPDCFDRTGEGANGTAGERSGLGIEVEVAYALRAKRAGGVAYAPEIARCVATREGSSQDYETTTMVAQAVCVTGDITHALKAEGADASEDGTGRGNPIIAFDARQTDVLVSGDITAPLDTKQPGPAICFSAKDYGADATLNLSPTLRAGGHTGSHANAGVMPAVAYTVALRGREGGGTAELGGDVATALRASTGGGDKPHVLTSAVRRLTPRECERLMGFPSVVYLNGGEMTRDEVIVAAIVAGYITVDVETGEVFKTRGSKGVPLLVPERLWTEHPSGYLVGTVRIGAHRKQIRLNRVVWIAANGVPPDGIVVDHINNDKHDNRLSNLQLLSGRENSYKAREDGLYHMDDHPLTKTTVEMRDQIFRDYVSGEGSYSDLAASYGITKGRVGQIVREHGYTEIPWRKKAAEDCPDGPRYKALGNSWAVPKFVWLGRRIAALMPAVAANDNTSNTESQVA